MRSVRPAKECTPLLTRIVAWSAAEYSLGRTWRQMFSTTRGTKDIQDARTLAMSVAMAAGIPTATVSKAFKRSWQSVDSCRQTMMRRVETDTYHRDLFISVLVRSLNPGTPAPELPKA